MNRWQLRISRPDEPAVPIYVSRMRRTFWCPPRYRAIAVATLSGKPFRLRQLAEQLGYSLTGLRHALARMSGWGMFRIVSTRGRFGSTRLRWSDDVTSNVPSTDTEKSLIEPERDMTVTVNGTFKPASVETSISEPVMTWKQVGEMLRQHAILPA